MKITISSDNFKAESELDDACKIDDFINHLQMVVDAFWGDGSVAIYEFSPEEKVRNLENYIRVLKEQDNG